MWHLNLIWQKKKKRPTSSKMWWKRFWICPVGRWLSILPILATPDFLPSQAVEYYRHSYVRNWELKEKVIKGASTNNSWREVRRKGCSDWTAKCDLHINGVDLSHEGEGMRGKLKKFPPLVTVSEASKQKLSASSAIFCNRCQSDWPSFCTPAVDNVSSVEIRKLYPTPHKLT